MAGRRRRSRSRVRYPVASGSCVFGVDGPGDLDAVVRARHRAEAQEWLALFALFRQESERLGVAGELGLQRDEEVFRTDAADATCARWVLTAQATVGTTRYRLRAAIQLFEHLPLLAQAFLDGLVSGQVIKQIVDRTYEVDVDLLPALDAALRGELVEPIAGGVRFSANALDSAVDEIVMLLDPDGVHTTRRTARRGIGVRLEPLLGGAAKVEAVMPGAAGATVMATVEDLARRLHDRKPVDDEGKRLTVDFCRSVALLVLTAGRGALAAAGLSKQALGAVRRVLDEVTDPVGGGAQVSVTVHAGQEAADRPSDSLPVWIARLGLLPSAAAADLLATARRVTPRAGPAGQLRPGGPLSWLGASLTPPEPAAAAAEALAVSGWEKVASLNRAERRALARLSRDQLPGYALRYRIPDWLKAKVRLRDGGCRFPGCGVPAADCDVDHLEPFLHADPISGGWTIELNLGCLCRRHHRLKTHDEWRVTTDLEGVFTFTAPDGTVAHTYPAGPAGRIGLGDRIHAPDDDTAESATDPPDAFAATDEGIRLWIAETDGHDPEPTSEEWQIVVDHELDLARRRGWHEGAGVGDMRAA